MFTKPTLGGKANLCFRRKGCALGSLGQLPDCVGFCLPGRIVPLGRAGQALLGSVVDDTLLLECVGSHMT